MSISLTAHTLGHGVAQVDISVVVTGLLDQFCRLWFPHCTWNES